MSQQEPSKGNKKANNMTFAKLGSLSFLANKKRRLLTTNEIVQAIEREKGHFLKLLEVQQPVAPQSETNRQYVEVQPVEDQPVEELPSMDQVQMNSVTPQTDDQPEEQVEDVSTQNKIGRTQMHNVHARKERKLILLNRKNQLVGPTDDVVIELSSFLGTLARNAILCPFDILDWRSMDTKQDLWNYTKEKYIIPEAAYNWTMMTYYDPYDNDEVRMENRPGHIPECQFRELLKYWKFEKFKKMSETNTKNRKKLMNPHTAGKKSFALVRSKLEKEKETVSSKDLLVVTRTRKPGRLYKASNENTTSKIAEMEEI